ncbi:MAG: hypothetical protein IPJ41_16890 [Phycisphaerales bacterium]|nr:hypothetical protein [Phycisphaerales bacterium]
MTRPPRTTPPATAFDQLTASLLWPRLLRAPSLAARPQRIVIALFLVLVVAVIGRASTLWSGPDKAPFLDAVLGAGANAAFRIWNGLIALNTRAIADGFVGLFHDVPLLALTEYPVSSFVLGLPSLLAFAALGGSLCRSVACEFSQEIVHPWPRALAFGIARWPTMLGALLLPWGLSAGVALVLAIAGWVFFGALPALEVVGGALFVAALVLSTLAVLLLVLGTLGLPLLLPAAACEGADAIDAAQRVIAYACARPLRLLLYLSVGTAVGILAIGLLAALATGIEQFARATLASWAGAEGARVLTGAFPPAYTLDAAGNPRELGSIGAAAEWLTGLWSSVLSLIVAAYAVSYVCTSGTLIYLFMREVCDGQHHAELWTPGVSGVAEARMEPTDPAAREPDAEDSASDLE